MKIRRFSKNGKIVHGFVENERVVVAGRATCRKRTGSVSLISRVIT